MPFPSNTIIRTEDRLTCSCGARLVAEAINVTDSRFFAICPACHRDLFTIEFEIDDDDWE
jgi:hypothetical protein